MDDRRLDGNVAGGILSEIFPIDMTIVRALCAGCGAMEQAGALHAYVDAPGTVIRCPGCSNVLIRIVHGGGRYWLDLRGVACLQIDEWV